MRSRVTGWITPCSVTSAVIRVAGVTSNAGLKAAAPAGAAATPSGASTSAAARSSIGMSAPLSIERSNVLDGAAT